MELSEKTIGDIAFVTKLAGFEHTKYIQGNCVHEKHDDSLIPLFIGKTVRDGKIDKKFDWYIPKQIAHQLPRSLLKRKCLVLPYVGTIGDLAVFDASYEALLGSNIAKIELNPDCGYSEEFVYYYLKSPRGQSVLLKDEQGGIQKNITMEAIRNVLLPIVDEIKQEKIVAVLSALDDKIALNKKMNQKLESMAKRLYDYWFVQFDFPDENGRPYKTSGGPMTHNETLNRDIPEGWEVAPISELIEKNFNGEWGSEEFSEEGIRVHCVRGADIVDMVDMPVRYISVKKKDRLLKANDVIVEISGGSPTQSTGRATFVTQETLNRFDSPMTSSNFCQIVRLKDPKNASYFFEMWQKFYASNIFFNFEGKTSGIKNFQTDAFIAIPWIKPPANLLHRFDEIYQTFMEKKERLIAENQKLTTLRDKLLPLLMNGQVTVV